jgi:sigma-B regulation protein RsbU (phosphoserine phosphatase)
VFGTLVRQLTWPQRITLVLVFAAALNLMVQVATGSTRLGEHFQTLLLTVVLLGVATLFTRFRLLWRLRNRLLLTYFLFGVVPILLIGLMLVFAGQFLFGQLAADRMRQELDRRTEVVRVAARDIALTPPQALPGFVSELRRQIPGLRVMIHAGDRVFSIPADAELREIPGWSNPGFDGVFESGAGRFLGAHASGGPPTTDVFAYVPLDQQTLSSFTPGVSVLSVVNGEANLNFHVGNESSKYGRVLVRVGFGSTIYSNSASAIVEAVQGAPLPPSKGFWDPVIGGALPWSIRTPSGASENLLFTLASRPSALLAGLGGGVIGLNFAIVLLLLGGFFLMVEVMSLISSMRLTRSITGSVHDLYQATQQVASGDFSHRTPIRGKDQLSELAGSFNSMTEHIQKLIVEVREKEKLESELQIAREVQLQLFPKGIPKLKTLELAALCIPSRFVSGDYYDFVSLGDRGTALALGDISGKGISAALLMASVQSSLHAQLMFSGTVVSTATLMGRLSQQLYENTPAAKYATFFCSVYDDQTGTLLYTNAGHLPPILVRGGQATPLSGDGMVVGLLPNVSYEQQTIELKPGDLLAVFSDGIPEAADGADEQFGVDRLGQALIQHAHKPLEEIIRIVADEVRKWAPDFEEQDDTTILLARRLH